MENNRVKYAQLLGLQLFSNHTPIHLAIDIKLIRMESQIIQRFQQFLSKKEAKNLEKHLSGLVKWHVRQP